MYEVAWELGRGCGAAAWCYALWTVHTLLVGYWPEQAQEEFFANPDALACSSFHPVGKTAEPVAGGYRVSGRWEFSSGCDHSNWALLGATVPTGPIWVMVPRSDFEILDNWYVAGLCGSGSKDLEVKDEFVPTDRTLDPERAGNGDFTGWELHQQARYRVPLRCLLGWDILSPLIGIVRGTVDQFVSRIRARLGRGGLDSRAPDSAAMQMRLAESTAELDAARTILMHDVREILSRAARGERFSPLDRARYLRDRAFSAKLCLQAANCKYEACGGHAVFQSEPIQRLHRDAHVLVHREAMMMDVIGQIFGRLILEENASPLPWQVQGIDG